MKATIAYRAICIYLCFVICAKPATSQSPVLQFIANYVTVSSAVNSYSAFPNSPGNFSACVGTSDTYTWSNGTDNQLKLTSFTANSKTYIASPGRSVAVKLRRVDNATVTGIRNILYSESTTSPSSTCPASNQLNFKAPYNDDMASFLNNNVLNHGTDNLFTNAGNGDGNNNNIERVDVIFPFGIASSIANDAGFALFERGATNAHDGFRIMAILSLNGSNDPASFGAVKTCVAGNGANNGSWGHPSIANGNKLLAAYVMRKDAADTYLRVSSNVNQELGGVYFSFTDLGIANNQVIYGYSLIGPDGTANPSSAQLLNITDAAIYPTGTTEAGGGGLDLISINTFFGTSEVLANGISKFFRGTVQNTEAVLNWELIDLPNETRVSLERSESNALFTTVYTYSYDDQVKNKTYRDKPGAGSYYYRLRVQSASGQVKYSPLVNLRMTQGNKDWRVYPIPARVGQALMVKGIADGSYVAHFQGLTSTLYSTKITAQGGKAMIKLNSALLPPGIYFLWLEKDGERIGKGNKILIQNN